MAIVLRFKIKDFIGVPYKDMDCWQLVKKYYKEVLNIEISYVAEGSASLPPEERQSLISSNKGNFVEVPSIKEAISGDILLISIKGIQCHMGIYLGGNMFLHTTENNDSVIDRVEKWKKLITGIYRVKVEDDNLKT